jgi:Ca2+-binding RTX toxin-like protein
MRVRLLAIAALLAAASAAVSHAAPRKPTCFGKPVTITGTSGRDVLRGTDGPDVIAGRAGHDLIIGGGGIDRICGGAGNDKLDGGPGSDHLDGGAEEADTALYSSATRSVVVDLARGRAYGAGNDRLVRVEWVRGSRFGDRLAGGRGANAVDGGEGDDFLVFHGHGSDRWIGGPGRDLLSFARIDRAMTVNLTKGIIVKPYGLDSIIGIEDLEGGPQRDTLTGDDGPNRLIGGPESDILIGAAGDDILLGGNEGDELVPGAGTDYADGQEGLDVVSYYGDAGVTASLRDGWALHMGARDVIVSFRSLFGSSGDDVLVGSDGPDSLVGLNGRDELYGLGGEDYLQGGYVINQGKFAHLDGGPGRDDCRTGRTYVNCEYTEP